jgi:hypothetical protein
MQEASNSQNNERQQIKRKNTLEDFENQENQVNKMMGGMNLNQ